jgi:hypothetical protein
VSNVVDLQALQQQMMAQARPDAAPALSSVQDAGQPLLVDGADFLDHATPPRWLIERVLQDGQVVSLTAPTNSGKTAVLLGMIMSVLSGQDFGPHPVCRSGRVLVLCGEDPDGFRLRMLATMRKMDMGRSKVAGNLRILPRAMALSEALPLIQRECAEWGDVAMVVVDTSVAFFSGGDENSNTEAYAHSRDLRALHDLPGKPTVVVACHPADRAERAMCKPRGGSAFLNEIDCNLILWCEGDGVTELHWSVKKRGPDFDPIWFEFAAQEVTCAGVTSRQVVAAWVDDERAHARKLQHYHDDNRLLVAMLGGPNDSLRTWARGAGFMCGPGGETAQISKVQRCLVRLMKNKLVERGFSASGYVLNGKGKSAAEIARDDRGH